jgi:beta-glucosidase
VVGISSISPRIFCWLGRWQSPISKGFKARGWGTSLKHYAVNNQEFERMATSSDLDERTLNEIYLPAFEMAVKGAQPWSVMSSYNLVNGIYASEDERLLQNILRDRWGFTGFIVSEWGGVNDRVESLRAGTDLEMPGTGECNAKRIIQAVGKRTLSAAIG